MRAVEGEAEADGAGGRRRSIPLFDPVAGMRAMADIQADGLRAASELLERMLDRDHQAPASRSRPSERDYTELFDAWADLLQRVAAGLAQPVPSGPVTIPVDANGVAPPVRLVLEGAEQVAGAVAEVWLHNGTSRAVGPLTLRCGPLTSPDGAGLDGAEVRFDPVELEPLPPRSSRGVLVSLSATPAPPPGIYRGTIQADGAPRLWLPLEAAVEPR